VKSGECAGHRAADGKEKKGNFLTTDGMDWHGRMAERKAFALRMEREKKISASALARTFDCPSWHSGAPESSLSALMSVSFVFIRVHSCSFVFIRVHSCSFVFIRVNSC
jgi:hypothetical protein